MNPEPISKGVSIVYITVSNPTVQASRHWALAAPWFASFPERGSHAPHTSVRIAGRGQHGHHHGHSVADRQSRQSRLALAADPVKAEPAAKPAAPQLPIAQAILFSSGVGYFQREGQVEGNARIDLSFPVQNINDLLKSMVLQDLGGGTISTVNYDSHDPINKTLQSFAINLSGNPSFGQLLNQARGEKVEIVLQQSNTTQAGTLTGTIVGVEQQKQPVNKEAVVEVEFLNVMTADGLRSIRLADVQRLRFVNPLMDKELGHALEVLAKSHDTQKKAVSLSFTGQGKRRCASATWSRTRSGRRAIGWCWTRRRSRSCKAGRWSRIPAMRIGRMCAWSLVSGRPISFQMDLYQPLYVPRPVVEPELFASLRPPTYSGDMNETKWTMRRKEARRRQGWRKTNLTERTAFQDGRTGESSRSLSLPC